MTYWKTWGTRDLSVVGGDPGGHPRTIPPLILSAEDRADLERLARSRTAPVRAVTRARVLSV